MYKHISNNHPESMFVTWEIMNTCNYSCSYCSPELYDGTSPMPEYTDALDFFKFVDNNINNGPKLLSLSGGEPTLWPKLVDFVSKLPDNYYVELVTNGSRTIRWWHSLFEKTNRIYRVSLSTHLEFCDKEHIINLCNEIHEKCVLSVMILFDINYLDKAVDIAQSLKQLNLNLNCRFKPITYKNISKHNTLEYNKKHKELIKKYNWNNIYKFTNAPIPTKFVVDGQLKEIDWATQLMSSNQHIFTGMFCEAGSKRLYIDHKGNIFGATCKTARNNMLGNIHSKEIKIINGLICDSKFCPCVPDIRIPKYLKD